MTPDQLQLLFIIIGSTVVPVVAVGIALAVLILRVTSRLDADRRAFQAAADADRRAHQARFDTAMDVFRAEMQRLAERQSHVEGRVAERGAAAD